MSSKTKPKIDSFMYDRVGVLFGAALFMFGVIAGVLGYQRRSVVLILFPLILLVGVQIYLEYVMGA